MQPRLPARAAGNQTGVGSDTTPVGQNLVNQSIAADLNRPNTRLPIGKGLGELPRTAAPSGGGNSPNPRGQISDGSDRSLAGETGVVIAGVQSQVMNPVGNEVRPVTQQHASSWVVPKNPWA